MKIITLTLLLSLAIMPTARADTPSDFCASLAFGIEVYKGLDQARAIRTSTRGVPRRTRGTADRNQEPAESGLAARPSGMPERSSLEPRPARRTRLSNAGASSR